MKMQGCLAGAGGLLCWLGCLLGMVPYIAYVGWPFALIGSLLVWSTQVSIMLKVVMGLLPLLVMLGWYWYFLTYIVY